MKFPWFNKNERDLEFIDSSRSIYPHFPVQRAKDVKPLAFDHQKKQYNKFLFPVCPGMIDYSQLGYIIPAWVDMHIKANKAGVVSFIGSRERGTHGMALPQRMNTDVIDGFIKPTDEVPLTVVKFDSPWSIFTKGKISALLMPPLYHAGWLEDLHVWSGVVDYKNFHACNFICSPKRKCEVHIKSGDPLMHVIPFWTKDILAGYGPGRDDQLHRTKNSMPGDDSQYYRKNQMINKKFNLSKGLKND